MAEHDETLEDAVDVGTTEDDQYIDKGPINEGSSSIFGNLSFSQIGIRLLLVLAVIMFAVKLLWPDSSNNNSNNTKVQVAKGVSGSDKLTEPGGVADKLLMEDIVQDYNQNQLAQAGHGKATVAPPTGVETKKDPSIEAKTNELKNANPGLGIIELSQNDNLPKPPSNRPKEQGKKKSNNNGENPYVRKISNLYSIWDQGSAPAKGVNLSIPSDLVAEVEQERVDAQNVILNQDSRQILMDRGVEYLRVLPATLDLGYNSDTGGLMIVTVHHPALEGVKFLADTTVGAYNERAAITLRKALLEDGKVLNVEGVVVDQKERIPSVTGDIDRHLLRNSIYGLGTSLLDSFAAFKQLDSGLVNSFSLFPPVAENQQTVDSDGLLVANGADALSRSIKEAGSFRPNTLTTEPFMSVGVVFIP